VGDPAWIAGDEQRAVRDLRLAPSMLRRGDLMTLELPAGLSGVVEVWDLAGRRIGVCPLAAAGDRAILPARGLFDRSAGNGVFVMRWTPEQGAPGRATRVLVLGD
jgi:hypothetical protein